MQTENIHSDASRRESREIRRAHGEAIQRDLERRGFFHKKTDRGDQPA
jgi:hypothetical protein